MCEDDSSSECLSDDDPGLALMFEHAFGVETEDELGVELESLCESSCGEVGLVELQRTSSQQSREDPVVLEDPVELVLVNSRSIMLEGTSIQQSGEDPVALEDPVELASLDRILHDDTPEAEFCHVFHECEESVDFESCLGDSDVGDLVELAVDVDMCAAVTRSKQSNTEVAGAASDAMWWLVDSGASTHLINEETLQGVRVVSQTEHAGVDCVTATGASVGIRKSAVVQVEFRLDDPEGQTVLVELEVLVAPVRFNLLSLGRLLDRSWDVQFVPEFCVKAAKFSFLTRRKQNCGWLLSVPSVSSSASSVLGSQAPCGDGREGGGKQPVFSVDRGREREGGHHSEQHGAGVGLRGRALRGHRDHKRADQEDPCSKGGSQGTPKSAQCSSEGASQQQYRTSGKEDAEEDRGPEIRKTAQMPWLLRYCAKKRLSSLKKATLKRCKAKTRARHYAKPDEHLTFSALEREMDRKLAAKEAPKRSLWDHLESQPVAALDRGTRGRQLHKHLLCREANGHDGVEDSRVWDERSSPRRHRQGLLLQDPRASEGSSKEEASYPAKATSAGRSTDDPTTNTEDINYSEDAGNRQQGLFARGSSGDRVACFVAVPRHGLKKQEARSITSPHDTATTSATIDSPTSSSVVLGKSPRRVVLENKKVFGCACCEFVDHVDHVEHVELGCDDLHVEHDVGMAVGDLQELPDAAENPEAWLLRGDRELLQLEQWGKVNRDHVLRSHIPFNASCEHCVRGRGLEPARRVEREEGEGVQKEVQVDKFQYKGLWFLVLVLVGCFAIGAVQYREVSGPRGNEARESMLADMSAWGRSVGLVGVDARDLSVCVRSDLEGVVRNHAQGFADGLPAGAVEVTDVPVGRHAPVAERAVRTLKESANALCVGFENVGLEPYGNGVMYLLKHCAQAHNRYAHLQGSALSPEQKALKSLKAPRPMYVWGAAVLATPPPSLRDKIIGRYGQAAYLGLEVASGSHIVQFRLRDGSYKVARSARIRMVVPVTFELSCLRGVCRLLPGRSAEAAREFPRIEGENVRDLPLPDTATKGPPREWVEQYGRTPRCRVCRARGIDVCKAYHSPDCRRRYSEFIKNAFDLTRFLVNEGQSGLEDYEFLRRLGGTSFSASR